MSGIPKYKRKKYIEMAKEYGYDGQHCSNCDEYKEAKDWTLFACNLPWNRLNVCDCDYSCLCLEECNDCTIQGLKDYLSRKKAAHVG